MVPAAPPNRIATILKTLDSKDDQPSKPGRKFSNQVKTSPDGANALEGHWIGGKEFVSFDKQAVTLLRTQGQEARLLS
jgi:hypothetical protein